MTYFYWRNSHNGTIVRSDPADFEDMTGYIPVTKEDWEQQAESLQLDKAHITLPRGIYEIIMPNDIVHLVTIRKIGE